MNSSGKRIVVGMSGGVDSSVTASLLRDQGYEVIGVTLQLQPCQEPGERRSCCGVDSVIQARAVAGQLGIPHYVLDCREAFNERVLRPCWEEYARGRTPNPCVLCNAHIKFGVMLEFAGSLGADAVATGHYAALDASGTAEPVLRRGRDRNKDQSYFLFALSPAQLRSACFPLGELTKGQVREVARQRGLVTAERPESQDICFAVDDAGFGEYLRRHFDGAARPGEITDTAGTVVGRHEGVHLFTVGQRRGVGVALGRPAWVKAIHAEHAQIEVTTAESDLFASGLIATQIVRHAPFPSHCLVQTRYRQRPVAATLDELGDGRIRVTLAQPLRAVTPGQAVVFYEEDRLLGGGWIGQAL